LDNSLRGNGFGSGWLASQIVCPQFPFLPKGVYVFEYSARVVHKGRYQSGMAEIQCMYAPEFNSHSGSVEIEAR
jgi:uncharacterized protein YfaS (alpha-2-macroglobulin family)